MQRNVAEDITESVLSWLKRHGRVSGYLRNNQGDRLDSEGIDFLIFLKNGLAIPLQVKTSSNRRNNEEKINEHFRKHPQVKNIIMVDIHTEDRRAEYRKITRYLHQVVKDAARTPSW